MKKEHIKLCEDDDWYKRYLKRDRLPPLWFQVLLFSIMCLLLYAFLSGIKT